ncbi:MAG: hypothetical protein UX61_C0014G0010 [Parcubacteria group bacterium GW2011_GWA2_46_7]|nr:MAG: hypothetical protein UX15_C0032G0005 [Parcubacteria group bacterium GW2011_GWA1_45_7]KKU10741.1 MAG: hypothetical protein UX14_C0010G0024 [Parcubacteria group bacterium GW2011_GWF1_45_5]KKU43642.1 MAG: hypothetical protein UX61_C0014G0010 [Parcubacteria group bacterium GW2011_GWA2_46_7]OHD12211.1 MAG: hypothetical protein A2Z96_03635 [Spirochaetes bacterium GWB1_48_6]
MDGMDFLILLIVGMITTIVGGFIEQNAQKPSNKHVGYVIFTAGCFMTGTLLLVGAAITAFAP